MIVCIYVVLCKCLMRRCCLFFFFKQKTAYEMRISDWSSDVCSSDLKTVHSVAHGVIRLEELSLDYGPERRRMRVIKYRGRHFRGGFHDFVIERGEIGRASCRERVCQYV